MSHPIEKKTSLWLRLLAPLCALFIRAYILTLKVSFHGYKEACSHLKNTKKGAVLLLWHDSIFLMPLLKTLSTIKPMDILISNSKDGDLPSQIAKSFHNIGVIRVGHLSRQTALKTAIDRLLGNHTVIFTPDGPRGPSHQIKEGSLFAAHEAGSPIIPIVWAASRQLRLHSWDRFKIPLPFSTVHLSLLPPIPPTQQCAASTLALLMEEEEARLG